MGKTKKYPTAIIYLEHDTKKPIKQRLKTSGFGGLRFAGKIANWIRQGYRLIKIEGHPEDPIVQYIQNMITQEQEQGKVTLDQQAMFKVASEVTGAKVEDIKEKMDNQLEKWKKRFKGVMPI